MASSSLLEISSLFLPRDHAKSLPVVASSQHYTCPNQDFLPVLFYETLLLTWKHSFVSWGLMSWQE